MTVSAYAAGFITAFGLGWAATWWLRGAATHLGLIDHPGEGRHIHLRPIPVVGGVAIFAAVLLTALFLVLVLDLSEALHAQPVVRVVVILAGATAVHILGLCDDLRSLMPWTKFLWQVAIATAVFLGGVSLSSVYLPFMGVLDLPFWVDFPLTVLWLVAITNAFNLVDGSDGLGAGVALVATVFVCIASLFAGQQLPALLLIVMAGALLGFLLFNFPPASVFLGDSGSLLLGFLLAGLGLIGVTKAATAVAITVPVAIFGLPIVDTILAVVRRLLGRRRIFRADREHVHHQLRDLGHSPRQVALILYAACGVFGMGSLFLLSDDGRLIALAFLLISGLVGLGAWHLRAPKLSGGEGLVVTSGNGRRAPVRSLEVYGRVKSIERVESTRIIEALPDDPKPARAAQ